MDPSVAHLSAEHDADELEWGARRPCLRTARRRKYGTGNGLTDRSKPAKVSGNLNPEYDAASSWARMMRFASSQ
jgi:hypothetical protein